MLEVQASAVLQKHKCTVTTDRERYGAVQQQSSDENQYNWITSAAKEFLDDKKVACTSTPEAFFLEIYAKDAA